MEIKRISDEVFYAGGEIIEFGARELDFLKAQTARNPRKRARLCTHIDAADRLHEMIIVNVRDTYVRPHKNTNKPKSFQVLEGRMDVVVFDDHGTVISVTHLGSYDSGRPYYFRLHETRYHTLRTTSDIVLFQETTIGPFRQGDTVFAPWAPEDGQVAACAEFLKNMDAAVARLNR
ncbi:MAG TPA: WbuC family cupin fold metalloprotein [Candidatus Nitrosotalea sp.]|nr:WbuC family cupin fold metalloprotein [Candidatus Nitrosotalea sp.]